MNATMAVVVFIFAAGGLQAQKTIRKEIPVGHAPLELVKPAVAEALSPQGRFVMLPNKGSMMVIDTPEAIKLVEAKLAKLEVPTPKVGLNFAFKTGVAGGSMGKSRPVEFSNFPFPTRFLPARIIPAGPNNVIIIPPHPTEFTKRNVGTTLDTQNHINPDGSISVDINFEHTEFEGFINYGSGIFPSGTSGVIPVNRNIRNPRFFNSFLNQTSIPVPIFSTTRITTQILVRPTVNGGMVKVDMFPQLTLDNGEKDVEPEVVTLKQFRTSVDVRNNGLGKLNGFKGATGEFNRNFLGGDDEQEGTNAIVIKAQVFHGEVKEAKAVPEPENKSQSEAMNKKLVEDKKTNQ